MNKCLPIVLLLLSLFGCKTNNAEQPSAAKGDSTETAAPEVKTDSPKSATSLLPPVHNARTSLDWEGSDKGMVPCADCEGIETLLTIRKDNTYEMEQTYLGKGDGKPMVSKGNWSWLSDNVIRLIEPGGSPTMVMVNEGKLLLLDKSGNRITSELANNYFLYKL